MQKLWKATFYIHFPSSRQWQVGEGQILVGHVSHVYLLAFSSRQLFISPTLATIEPIKIIWLEQGIWMQMIMPSYVYKTKA